MEVTTKINMLIDWNHCWVIEKRY